MSAMVIRACTSLTDSQPTLEVSSAERTLANSWGREVGTADAEGGKLKNAECSVRFMAEIVQNLVHFSKGSGGLELLTAMVHRCNA
jgi:hypothetical protein